MCRNKSTATGYVTCHLSAVTSCGRALTSHYRPLTSNLSAIPSYGRAITTYCRPETSQLSAMTIVTGES